MTRQIIACVFALLFAVVPCSPGSAADAILTVVVDELDSGEGTVDMLVFDSPRGWPEDARAAIRVAGEAAKKGRATFRVQLPPGEYAVVVIHDANGNEKLDRNSYGAPVEQWGMSNNPRPNFSAPPFDAARFGLKGDLEIHISLQ